MKLKDLNREDRFKDIQKHILTTNEVIEMLGFTRARLNNIIREGRIKPIKRGIFLKEDVQELAKALKKNEKYRPHSL